MSIKATFVLDESVIQNAREYTKENRFKSLSAFVEQSIRNELERRRQEKITSALLAAGSDPLFMADVIDINDAFEHSDLESA
jgi:Arc/MetJ-type ribon-helix-helix transcriptional regulator